MTDTTTRPLPTDMATLRQHYLPAEPESTVTAALAGIRRLDAAIADTVAQLEERDRVDRNLVAALVDAAIAGNNLDKHVAQLSQIGDRPALTHRLDQLHNARTVGTHRHATAQRTDPIHLGWRQRCEEVTREWNIVMASETSEDRFAGLVAFSQRH